MRVWMLLLVACACAIAAPRLLLTPEKRDELRAAVRVAGSPHEAMLGQLRDKVEKGTAAGNYERSYRATMAAFLFQMTGEARYCAVAERALRDLQPDAALEYGLARATVGIGFAFAHDWCGDALGAEPRDWVRSELERAADAWPAFRHANVDAEHKGSNWVAVCRGGELIELIALGREKSERFALVKADLRRHMQNYDELGVSQEGIGYTGYGGIFLLRALLALRAIGDLALEEEAARHAWWKQAMYSGTFADTKWLQSGVSGDGIGDEGWASLLFAFTPKDQLPYFRWWYERHMGSRFDPRREGPVWAMLCFPARVAAKDPTGLFPAAVAGRGGLVLFRNRWRDADDMLVSFHADATWHSHAWDQPEALQWHVFAYGSMFAAGPGKDREPEKFTTLLVDGSHVAAGRRGTTGKLVRFSNTRDGAVAVASGGSQYPVEVKREFAVSFLDGNRALIRVHDRMRASEKHRYAAQIHTGAHIVVGEARLVGLRGVMEAKPGLRVEVEGSTAEIVQELRLQPRPSAH